MIANKNCFLGFFTGLWNFNPFYDFLKGTNWRKIYHFFVRPFCFRKVFHPINRGRGGRVEIVLTPKVTESLTLTIIRVSVCFDCHGLPPRNVKKYQVSFLMRIVVGTDTFTVQDSVDINFVWKEQKHSWEASIDSCSSFWMIYFANNLEKSSNISSSCYCCFPKAIPGSNFFGKTPLFFRYSGVNAANAVNLQAKRR